MKHKQTYSEGANDERTAIIAKLRRELYSGKGFGRLVLLKLIKWIEKRHLRCDKRPGGLGRKAKKA